jgi:hypothetical protein
MWIAQCGGDLDVFPAACETSIQSVPFKTSNTPKTIFEARAENIARRALKSAELRDDRPGFRGRNSGAWA